MLLQIYLIIQLDCVSSCSHDYYMYLIIIIIMTLFYNDFSFFIILPNIYKFKTIKALCLYIYTYIYIYIYAELYSWLGESSKIHIALFVFCFLHSSTKEKPSYFVLSSIFIFLKPVIWYRSFPFCSPLFLSSSFSPNAYEIWIDPLGRA